MSFASREAEAAYKEQWYRENKARILESRKVYYQINREAKKRAAREYYHNNSRTILKKNSARQKLKRRNDPLTRTVDNLRKRVWDALAGKCKSASTLALLGCDVTFLKSHIEAQFKDGMNWENYGEWHIDHIRPCASFDLTLLEEQMLCFNYRNLQPLWASDNIRKGAKWLQDPSQSE